jgi:hypothetical protein
MLIEQMLLKQMQWEDIIRTNSTGTNVLTKKNISREKFLVKKCL